MGITVESKYNIVDEMKRGSRALGMHTLARYVVKYMSQGILFS